MVDPALVKKIEGAPFQYGDRVKILSKKGPFSGGVGEISHLQYTSGLTVYPSDPMIMVSFGEYGAYFWKEELETAT
jgi:hypothetical protein